MKAQILYNVNDICYEDTQDPVLREGQVLVKVHAAGICGSDIPRIYVNGTYHFPTIPGHEFSGEVVDTFEGEDKELCGKRVGIFPLIPCMECSQCRQGHYEMCKHYDYLGSRSDGGFAEYVAVPKWNLIELPDSVTYEQAAMLEPMAVAVHAIRKAFELKGNGFSQKVFDEGAKESGEFPDDFKIAVTGLGTIGLFIVMFLKNIGFENVYAIGNKNFQKETALNLGISEDKYYDYKSVSDSILNSFDLVFEVAGRNETINFSLVLAAPSGSVCFVGNPESDISFAKDVYWMILRKQLSITGIWNSSFTRQENDDWHYVLDQLSKGAIHPENLITHRFSLDKLQDGLELMHTKKENYIKVMSTFP